MQFHIIGRPSTEVANLSAILDFLSLSFVVEDSFSGDACAAVILMAPFDLSAVPEDTALIAMADAPREVLDRALATVTYPLKQPELLTALRTVRICTKLKQINSSSADTDHALENAAHGTLGGLLARITGDHPLLDEVRTQIAMIAEEQSPVLLQGEVGTGKRTVAEVLHACSSRREGPFVPVSCATFPEALLAAELFGCERGAMPGALSRRLGRVEIAEGGTLLLEDIEALSIQSQASLLTLLRTGQLERIGAVRGHAVDIRLIASTTTNLSERVERGEFRDDLYYALQGLQMQIPSLREYREIVPDLLTLVEPEIPRSSLSADACLKLSNYAWPGNLTELRGVAKQLVGSSLKPLIEPADLPERFVTNEVEHGSRKIDGADFLAPEPLLPVNGLDLKAYLADLEKSLIAQALDDTGSIVARAADRLHIRRTTLVEKMRKYGLRRG